MAAGLREACIIGPAIATRIVRSTERRHSESLAVRKTTKRQKERIGDVVRIKLGDGFHSYARILEEGTFAFYDCRTRDDLPIDKIISSPVLFFVPVMRYAVARSIWEVIGNAPLEAAVNLQRTPTRLAPRRQHTPGSILWVRCIRVVKADMRFGGSNDIDRNNS